MLHSIQHIFFSYVYLSVFVSLLCSPIILHPLPSSNVVHASSGLIMHYLSNYSPSNRIVSFTVSVPMTIDMCYLIPINAIRKIPHCQRPPRNPASRSTRRQKRFITDIVSIGIGSAALALSTINSLQILALKHEVTALTNSLASVSSVVNTHTTQLIQLQQGQLKLAQELNCTQAALNQTIALVNDHSTVLDRHRSAIETLATFAQFMNAKLTSFIHSIETHFLHTALSDILNNRLNLNFIHHNDLPLVLDFILSATNVSINTDFTILPLVDLVSRLLLQQRIDFAPRNTTSTSRGELLGVLLISSFFAATTSNQPTFSLYELLPIPFPYGNLRVRLADMPHIVGIDYLNDHLLRWTLLESASCDFRSMSLCRETPPVMTSWNDTCLFEILTNVPLTACRTEQYLDPVFIHRLGDHWAISTNSTSQCHTISSSNLDQPYVLQNNIRVLPPVSLITIPVNTSLVCDRFTIPSSPLPLNISLTILDSSLLNASAVDFFDLHLPLSNVTRWPKLPFIPNHLQNLLDFLASTPTMATLPVIAPWYTHPSTFFSFGLLILFIVLLVLLLYGYFIRKPPPPTVHLELATIA